MCVLQAGESEDALQQVRSSLAVISMAASKEPHLVAERLDLLLKVCSQHYAAIRPNTPLRRSHSQNACGLLVHTSLGAICDATAGSTKPCQLD